MTEPSRILIGDTIEQMGTLPEKCVQCCVTSPPYWGLRSYLPDGVKLRADLTSEQLSEVMKQLETLGISPIAE